MNESSYENKCNTEGPPAASKRQQREKPEHIPIVSVNLKQHALL
jgi:hypothetical protein